MTEPDLQEPFAYTSLRITCPNCAAVERDDYEVLDDDEVLAIKCGSCGEPFHLLIAECNRCSEESTVTWPDVPTPEEIRAAPCSYCNARVFGDG